VPIRSTIISANLLLAGHTANFGPTAFVGYAPSAVWRQMLYKTDKAHRLLGWPGSVFSNPAQISNHLGNFGSDFRPV